MDWTDFDSMIEEALDEDGARKDVTTQALIPGKLTCEADVVAKECGVVCGLSLACRICEVFDERLKLCVEVEDATSIEPGQKIATCRGPASSLLTAERVMLNFLQRLSGVATLTRQYVKAVQGTGADILDTRKTTPGWRRLEKYAVRCGGGVNHRMGLHDMVLIKDNHLRLRERCGKRSSIEEAIEIARQSTEDISIEVEVESLAQLEEALRAAPDYVLLDNMSPNEVRQAVELTQGSSASPGPQLEASGAIGLENVRAYGEAGVDRISIGALTHSAAALDISLNITV